MIFKLMIVEDEIILHEGLLNAIPWEEMGYEVVASASSGEEGIANYESYQPDVVMTDIKMYEVSGLDLLRTVKQINANCEVVLLSGYEDFNYAKQGLEQGAYAYILKLNLFDEIEAVFRKLHIHLTERKQEQQLLQLLQKNERDQQIVRRLRGEKGLYPLPSTRCCVIVLRAEIGLESYKQQITSLQISHLNVVTVHEYDLIIILHGKDTVECFQLELQKLVYQLQRLEQTMDTEAWVGVGEVTESDNVEISYQKAYKMLDYARLHRGPRIMKYNEYSPQQTSEKIEAGLTNLQMWIEVGNTKELFDYLDKSCKQYIYSLQASIANIKNICVEILVHYHRELNEGHVELDEGFQLDNQIHRMSGIDSVLDLQQWMSTVILKFSTLHSMLSDEGDQRLAQALHYMDSHYDKDINMHEVARMVFLSPPYFSAKFKEYNGQTFTEYLKSKRIDRATELLLHTKNKVSFISKSVGYEDEKYFSRVFKNKIGVTPQQYREREYIKETGGKKHE